MGWGGQPLSVNSPSNNYSLRDMNRSKSVDTDEQSVQKIVTEMEKCIFEGRPMYVSAIQKVWIVVGNTDNTEGRGYSFPLHVCESPETAHRLGKRKSLQGSDCPVKESIAVKVEGKWFYPGVLERESDADKIARIRREKKEAVLEKARAAGLTDEELATLSQ